MNNVRNREVREFGVTALINAEVLSLSGDAPRTIANEARVKNIAGPAYESSCGFAHVRPDPDPGNNIASEDTLVIESRP